MHHVGMIPRSALILGAGLAGTALARALALRDWQVTLIDDEDPQAGSRQPALAVHPAHAPDDSPASGLSKIALALLAADAGPSDTLAAGWMNLPRLQRMPLEQARRLAQAWPDGPLQYQADGLLWNQPCAVEPRALLARWQQDAMQTGRMQIRHFTVDALHADAQGWHAQSADQTERVSAAVAIVCAGVRSSDLLRHAVGPRNTVPPRNVATPRNAVGSRNAVAHRNADTPQSALSAVLSAGGWQVRHAQSRISRVPVNVPRQVIGLQGEGYQIPLPDGRLLCGPEVPLRTDLRSLETPGPLGTADAVGLAGTAGTADTAGTAKIMAPRVPCGDARESGNPLFDRLPVGSRASVRDHLPLVGAVPDLMALEGEWPALLRNDRLPLPRVDGLWMICALGGRGLLWSLLAAEHVAAELSNTPSLLNDRLARAIDPGRFLKRSLRAGTPHLTKALGLA